MASIDLEYNSGFQIYNSDGTPFHDLVLHKCTYETVVMSLGDKISGILYYKDNALDVTMSEYIIYKGVRYTLVNPPTILREGLVSDNSELRGMTKYSFTFYHPMYVLNNFPFSDIAVQSGQNRYLSQNKTFSWIGTLVDFVAKLNKNLEDTQWMVTIGNVTQEEQTKLSEVLSFDKNTIAEALKRGYETWEVPYVVDQLTTSSPYYPEKRFVVQFGLPTTEILDEYNQPFVFQMGQGVGLKNNSRNPKNNKIITRIAGYGSEDNIPYGYPQIPYYGGNVQYPLYYGIVGGQRVQLIKHPFTRNHLMPSVYSQSVYNKVNPKLPNGSNNPNYDPTIELVDYYDANDNTYTNRIKPNSPSYEIHEFGDIKPELGEKSIISAVPVSQQETQPDYKQKSDFLQEILDRISATEIEDEKTELLDVYDRVDAGLSYYEKHGEEGGDTYWFVFSITRDDYYEYVSYESSNYNFTATVLRNGSSAPTPDWDDTMDDDGKYLQSYFKITLPILEFDLYACAAITQEMKINMRSGACIGCTFPVEVDWDDYKRNFYNSDGEFDPDGEQRDYTKYPDSSSGQITVMVKKELETFGTLMPNQYQQPTTGDKFVILGISLPNTYITSAEQRLDTDMKQYMRDNNVYYFDYPLKFDEHFLISHEDILSQMKNNVVVRFNYAGTEHALYIKQMSVKYNESPLPKYDITLTDDIEIVLNQIGQVTDEVSKLRLGFGAGGFGTVGAEYIRKDIDDTARGTIRMIKGMQVGERFVTGLLGSGGVFRKDSDGTTYLETDKLYVRMKAYFDTVEVKHYLHTGGNRIASQASGIVCSRVEMIDAYGGLAMDVADAVLFRCFFKANDGDKTIRNDFMIGDLAFCRETNVDVSSVNLHGYWRLVIGRNVDGFLTENKEAWIDLSNRASDTITVGGIQYSCAGYQNGSDAPIAQDDIIQLGNITDKDRQGAIVEYVGGEDAPSYQIFQGIGEDLPYPYTLEDKNYIGLGYSSQTGHAYMNVYGDVFIGAKPDAVTGESPTYIKYVQEDPETGEPKLTIKAVVEFQSPDDPQTTTTLDDFARLITGDIENIQSQIDGEIDTWFYAGIPTLQNAPANEWPTDAEKEKHTGDLYYDIGTGADAGKAYRFVRSQTTPYVYSWQYIDDTAITEALRIAAQAQDTADHKRRVFLAIPTPPYDEGDLWVNAIYPANYDGRTDEGNHRYNNDLLHAKKAVPRTEDGQEITTFSINDWELASKYTDDSALLDFLDGYQGTLTTIRNQVDAKAETWYQDEDPSTLTPQQGGWYGGDDTEHVGDIWFCTKNHASPSLFKKGTTWIWQAHTTEHGVSYAWEEQEIPDEVFDKIDGKSSIYANDPNDVDSTKRHPSNYKANDVWILPMIYVNGVLNPSTYTINNIVYGAGEMLTALRDNETYSAGDWAKKVRYTDDSALNDFKTNQYVQLLTGGQITSDISSAQQTADNAQTAADAAQTSADNANTKLTNWASDSYISPTEKTALKTEWEDVKTEYTQICNDADKYSIDKTAFTSAYTSANAAFQKYTAATPENITVGSDYQNIKGYYAARQTILNAISDAAKTLAQNAATAYMSDTALNAIKYALNGGSTTQDGGLILSNIIALRDANQNVMSGMNGVYNSQLTSGGIAAWYGGAMTDHEQSPSALNYAKSLFRFDGSGYLASGNITWDANGIVNIANVYADVNGVSTSLSGSLQTLTNLSNALPLTLRSGVTYLDPQYGFSQISITHDSNYVISDNSVLNYGEMKARFVPLEFFNALFSAFSVANPTSSSTPIDPSTWTAQTVINNLKINVGTWTEQYLSALGLNSSSSGGGGGDVYWSQLTANNSSTSQQIHASHLSSVTEPLYFLFNEDANPTLTYDGKTNKAVSGILTKTYADGRYARSVKYNGGDPITPDSNGVVDLGTIGSGDVTWDLLASSSDTHQIALSHLTTALSGYITLNTKQTVSATKTFSSGELVIYNEGETKYTDRTITSEPKSFLRFSVKDNTTGQTYSNCYIRATNDHSSSTSGNNLVIRPGGNLIMGGGECASGFYSQMTTKGGENTYLLADSDMFLEANANTIANRKGFRIPTSGDLIPCAAESSSDNTHNIGSTAARLANIYAVNFHGTLDGNATTATSLSSPVSLWGNNFNGSADISGDIHMKDTGTRYHVIYAYQNGTDNKVGLMWHDSGDASNVTKSQWNFRSYSPNTTADASTTGKYETYSLPDATKGLAANASYDILTTKDLSFSITGNAATATKLASMINVTIKDADSTNAGSGVSVDGSAAVTLLLPSTIKASLTGNASTATTLETSRTLWGQSFDGSANVSGNMTDVGSISARGNITITRVTTNMTYFRATSNNGSVELLVSSNRGVYDRTTTSWLITTNGTNSWLDIGNVGIGTSSPSYKLHVNGTFYASSNSSIGGTLGVTGATTLSSTLSVSGLLTASGGITIPDGKTLKIGDAELSWDATNQGIKITKGLYSETFISALGAGSGGSSGGGGDVFWSQLTANNSSTGQQIHASHLSSVTQPLYFLFNEDSNPTVTYDGKTNKAVGNILTKTYADGRYYQKIANGSASEVVLADGTSSKLKTINGNSIFGDGDIVISSSAYPSGTAELLAAGTDTTDRVWSAKILSENVGGRQYYGTCSSAAAAQAKVATIPANQNFRLAVGAIITIKFSNTNTFSATASDLITLNVNGTGAKQIWYSTSAANKGTNTACYGYKNRYITYIYDGTYWVWVSSGVDSNTTYSQGTADLLTAGTSTTSMIWQPKILRDEFDKYLPLNGGTMTGSIIMGTCHYIYGVDESLGSILFFDGSRTVIGSCGATSTRATHLRSKTGHLTCGVGDTASYTIWDSGNDGSSSGLDADLLDGQHGNYYAAASSLNDYLLKAGGVMTGELHTHHALEVYNGSSSTKESSYMRFTRNGAGGNDYAALGWNGTNVRLCLLGGNGNYTSEKDALLIGYDGQLKLQASNGTAPLTTSSTTLVSNLNADLLDGKDGTYYVSYNESTLGNNVDCNTLSNFSGNGFVIQPIYTPNYTGQTNFPVRGYGTMVCLGGNGTGFPFRFALYQQVGSTPVSIYVQNSEWQKSNFVGRTWSRILTEDATFTAPNGTCGYATTAGSATTANSATTASSATTAGYATTAGSAPASDVYAWAKASTKPSYNFNEIQDAADLGVSIGTVTRRVLLTRTKTDQGYRSRAAIGLTNVSGKFSPVILSVGTNDGGTSWMDYTFTADGWFQSEKVRSRNVTIWGNQVTDDSKGLFIQASDWSNRAWITWNGNTETTDYLNIHSVYGNINLTPAKNVGIGTTSPSTRLHVKGRVTCEYVDSTILGSFCNVRGDYLSNYGINSSGFTIITTGQSGASSSTVRISMTPYNATEPYVMIGRDSSLVLGSTGIASDATYRDGTYIQIGGARIVWDNANTALKVVKSDGSSAANFYATGAVSALGANTSSGGGGGDVYWSQLTENNPSQQIHASHLSSVAQPLYFLFNEDSSPSITYDGKMYKTVGNIITKTYADGRYVKQSGNAIISGTATIGVYMTIGATVEVGTVKSQVIQTLSNRAIFIKTVNAPHYVDGTWTNTSDIRLKDIINNVGASVDQIANAPIFNYKWKSGGVSIMLGSSAQYWQNVFQHAVEIGPENYLYMDYSSVALASAVMVARKVQNHEDRILKLERENEQLRNEIKQLKAA